MRFKFTITSIPRWIDYWRHETKKQVSFKFILVVLLFGFYFFYISHKYGAGEGFLIAFLTWSVFVLCTPIADAGFLLDFPMRIIFHLRMVISELGVWLVAITTNLIVFFFYPQLYQTTRLLKIFQHILSHPFPFWLIILLSCLGTFMSILFGDELLDKVYHRDRLFHQKQKKKYYLLVAVFIIGLIIISYDFLLKSLGISLDHF